jgi:hypothetical protein
MIVLSLERWDFAAGRWFVRTRVYFRGYIWTPLCKIYLRKTYFCRRFNFRVTP